jgi:hypothetical protein
MKNDKCKFNGKRRWLCPVAESVTVNDKEVFFHGENNRKSIRNDSRNTYLFRDPTRRSDITFGTGLTNAFEDRDDLLKRQLLFPNY